MVLHDKCLLPRTLFNQTGQIAHAEKREMRVPNEGVAMGGSRGGGGAAKSIHIASLLNCNELTNCRYATKRCR